MSSCQTTGSKIDAAATHINYGTASIPNDPTDPKYNDRVAEAVAAIQIQSQDGVPHHGHSSKIPKAAEIREPKTVDDLMVYVRHDRSPTARELGRPARQQAVMPDVQKTAYIEGRQDYNIWYDKFLTDRYDPHNRDERDPALTRCVPFTDSGWTRANFDTIDQDHPRICLFFAKGCCTLGQDCKFLHRIPTVEDNSKLDMLHDIFGRERHQDHRDDMDGVGSFNSDCKSLFIGGMRINRMLSDYSERVSSLLRRTFGIWGPIDSLRVIPNKNIAFLKYKYRAAAEFAKVAMDRQQIPFADDVGSAADLEAVAREGCLTVRWAHSNRSTAEAQADEEEERRQAQAAVERRMRELGYTDHQIACYATWGAVTELPSAGNVPGTEFELQQQSNPFGPMAHSGDTSQVTGPYPLAPPLEAFAYSEHAAQWHALPDQQGLLQSTPQRLTAKQIEAALEGRSTATGNLVEDPEYQQKKMTEHLQQMQTVMSRVQNLADLSDQDFNVKFS